MKYKIISFIIITLFIFGIFMNIYINKDTCLANIKDKIIRLHIIANSDSAEDQEIKLRVRDVVLKELSPVIKEITDTEKAGLVIKKNLDLIKNRIQNELKKINKDFPVEVCLSKHEFPTKVYGEYTLPKGEYQALNVKIGNGSGGNWWCVMFPPLCFVDIAQGGTSEDVLNEMKEVLSKEEISLLQNSYYERLPIKLKFKISEIYKNLNMKVAKIIRKNKQM